MQLWKDYEQPLTVPCQSYLEGVFMKKLILLLVIFVLITTAAFSQAIYMNGWGINAWGRGVFVPVWYESGDQIFGEARANTESIFYTGTGVSWDPNNQPRVDFRVSAASDYVGFFIHINSEFLAGTGNGDNGAQLWVKPFGNDLIRLLVANHFIDDSLRGKVSTDTGFENFVLGQSMMKFTEGREPLNQDVIFNRFAGGRGSVSAANHANTSTHISNPLANVFFLSSRPIDGLFLGLMLQGEYPSTELKESWRQVHAGIGYEIEDVGFVRAQYIGGFMGEEKRASDIFKITEPSKIEAAFAYTGAEDFLIDFGVKFWMPITTFGRTPEGDLNKDVFRKAFRGLDVALGGTYRNEDFSIAAIAQVLNIMAYTGARAHTPASDKGADGMHIVFNMIPSYGFEFGTIGLSLIAQTRLADTDTEGKTNEQSAWTRFGAGVFYQKGLASGSIKTGITVAPAPIKTGHYSVALPGGGFGPSEDTRTGLHGRTIVTIPVILEYAFF